MPQIFVFTAGNPEARQHLAELGAGSTQANAWDATGG